MIGAILVVSVLAATVLFFAAAMAAGALADLRASRRWERENEGRRRVPERDHLRIVRPPPYDQDDE